MEIKFIPTEAELLKLSLNADVNEFENDKDLDRQLITGLLKKMKSRVVIDLTKEEIQELYDSLDRGDFGFENFTEGKFSYEFYTDLKVRLRFAL